MQLHIGDPLGRLALPSRRLYEFLLLCPTGHEPAHFFEQLLLSLTLVVVVVVDVGSRVLLKGSIVCSSSERSLGGSML